MPKQVKIWGSVGILSTIFTTLFSALVLGVFGWFGQGSLQAIETVKDVENIRANVAKIETTVNVLNTSIAEFMAYSYEMKLDLEKDKLRIQYCEREIEKCREYNRD